MKKNNIIIQIALIGALAASMPLVEASAFRFLAGSARFAFNRKRLALGATGTMFATAAISQAQKADENQEQPKGIKSVAIRHPLHFNKDGIADNFNSSIGSLKNNNYQSYGDPRSYQNEMKLCIKQLIYGKSPLDWLFDRLVNVKRLSTWSEKYSFGIRARSETAEAECNSSAVDQNLSAHSITMMNTPTHNGRPALMFWLVNDNQSRDIIFWHEVAGIPSFDDTRMRLQAEVVAEKHDGSSVKSVWDIEHFTEKGCKQNYQKALVNKENVEAQEMYVEKCLKTPIKRVIPEDSWIVGL